MSKKFKSQASSARAANTTFGGSPAFGFGGATFQTTSSLSYVAEQPDLSGVSDPNVVVCLRNLGKKDSTTKAKALEELQDSLKSAGANVEDSVLTAWIDLYPRTSIDNSRRVRQLAHSLQGFLTSSAGRRIAPHLPRAVGPWLCGLYDNDRAVSRAAQDGLALSFPTEEKRTVLWEVYKKALLDYANDAVLVQTSATLSDERSTSKDDADSKLARVVGSAIYMLGQLIRHNRPDQKRASASFTEQLSENLANQKLWDLVHHDDPYIRRSICSLASLCAESRLDMNWTAVSAAFIAKGLQTSQLGSNGQFSSALLALTKARPEMWTTDYKAKTASSKRALQYFRRGSQRGPENVWTNFLSLFELIPLRIFTTATEVGLEDASTVADAFRQGVTNSEEPRQNLPVAWSCYFEVCFALQSKLTDTSDREKFYQDDLAPVVIQFVNHDPKMAFVPPLSILPSISKAMLRLVHSNLSGALNTLWSGLGTSIEEKMKLSLPETSKDFNSSQDELVKLSDRLFKIEKGVLDGLSPSRNQVDAALPAVSDGLATLNHFNQRVAAAAIGILKNRNGKPYGAAAILTDAASVLSSTGEGSELLRSFLGSDASQLMQSPSAVHLVRLTASLGLPLSPLLQPLINTPELDLPGEKAFVAILSTISQAEAASFPELGSLVIDTLTGESSGSRSMLFSVSVLQNPNLGDSPMVKRLVQAVLDHLAPDSASPQTLRALTLLAAALTDPTSATLFTSDEVRNQLLAKLVVLAHSADGDTSDLASKAMSKLKTDFKSRRGSSSATTAVVAGQLAGSSPSLPIFSLVDLAKEELASSSDKTNTLAFLLPTELAWSAALRPHVHSKPDRSLSITSPLHGAIYGLVELKDRPGSVHHDSEGLSQAFRLALYVTRLLGSTDVTDFPDQATLLNLMLTLIPNLTTALQLINEKITLDSSSTIWIEGTGEVLDEAAEVLSQAHSIIQTWVAHPSWVCIDVVRELWKYAQGNTPGAYYNSLALCSVIGMQSDHEDMKRMIPDLEAKIKGLYRSDDLLPSAALASCARDYLVSSAAGRRAMNEIISNATEVKSSEPSSKILRPIVLLNILLNGDSDPLEGIQSQRLVFLMQNLLKLLETDNIPPDVCSEVFTLLCAVLPAVQEIYGSHWQEILLELTHLWENLDSYAENLSLLHSSLRLCQRITSLAAAEEANEDLVEAWSATKPRVDAGLSQCLWSFDKPSEGLNQPRLITTELLARLISKADFKDEELPRTMRLLSSQDEAVIRAAYGILHRSIPKRQEELSIEAALGKHAFHLPTELRSLITQPPSSTAAQYSPAPLLCFFLVWKLVFDHFPTASYKLREAYAADLKEANCLSALLETVCEVVRITSGRPLDVSKMDFQDFELERDESEEKQLQRLAVHIYYLSLLYIPGLVKTWYIEQKNRIRTPLEAWTGKYISQAVVIEAFKSASEWAATQDADDNPVTVKTNASGRDLVASMEVDPESPPISLAVTLTSKFPLESPVVTGRTRVGVSEKSWQAWMRTFQIIIFSTGSIVEGLTAFRRNTNLALKGHGECAICYSIIGPDMQTPNKKCATCKNSFHGGCLFRWMSSSNSSTCPLCRTNFNFA